MVHACSFDQKHVVKLVPSFWQMSCVRMLEILPILFEELDKSSDENIGQSLEKINGLSDFSWLHDLLDWGKSSLEVVVRYWKHSMSSLLTLLKSSCNERSAGIVTSIEKLITLGKELNTYWFFLIKPGNIFADIYLFFFSILAYVECFAEQMRFQWIH